MILGRIAKSSNPGCRTKRSVTRGILQLLGITLFWFLGSPLVASAQSSEKDWRDCETRLIAAVHKRDSADAIRVLKSAVDLNAKPCGVTALFEAIVYDETNVVEALLAKGADPNVLDSTNVSPLSAAAFYCREEVLPLLISYGADINSVDENGYSALMGSTQNCPDGAFAATLLRFGAGINLRAKDGATALTVAAFYGNEDAVHVLVAAGADLAPGWGDEGNALTIARDREVGRKNAHDHIYAFLLRVTRLDAKRNATSNR